MAESITSFEELADILQRATVPQDIFCGDPARDFRRLAKLCHPDRFPAGPSQQKAHQVFIRLSAWLERASGPAAPRLIRSRLHDYSIEQQIVQEDLADVYLATAEGNQFALKICRSNGGNALMVNEFRHLQTLVKQNDDRSYRQYFPNPVESFVATGESAGRQVNVFAHREGFQSLEALRQQFADGLDARHLAWLFKRLLVVAGFARRCGVVHGGILPPHVLVHADSHGVQLVDWTQSVRLGGRLGFVPTRFLKWYPGEVLDKEPATPATDIFLAAKCVVYAAGGDPVANRWPAPVPDEMREFVDTCLYASPRMRPQDAWQVHEEFDELLLRLFGPPKFCRLE